MDAICTTVLTLYTAPHLPMLKQPVLEALRAKGLVPCLELKEWNGKLRNAVQMVPELRYVNSTKAEV